ncbi:hypothetical protein CAPTEDRAFT_204493 [Capitella teleta]|uniref:Uncharacterized protein n=1 Tax=Capitella teleta TaxID=283909 RepID=R7TCY0_CAPTE|nr:hypothetical protein CAPTEDRAFT_204493 [Capitella teleta]|eukprot:ELT91589.1 hypothetical protein CAPTEDRAFT_204493 [Capitella teleta]
MPVITEQQAITELKDFVRRHPCYDERPAYYMKVKHLKHSTYFHYKLETFSESRSTTWVYEPFHGEPIDGPAYGPAPHPWDIQVRPSMEYYYAVKHLEVPHTASVKPCHTCSGIGSMLCPSCNGHGIVVCTFCLDSNRFACSYCKSTSRLKCSHCKCRGHVPCQTCDMTGKLRCYIKLTITWRNHLDDIHSFQNDSIPDDLIRTELVSSGTSFSHTLVVANVYISLHLSCLSYPYHESLYSSAHVWAVTHFPDQTINQGSRQLVDKHRNVYNMERPLMQRGILEIVVRELEFNAEFYHFVKK